MPQVKCEDIINDTHIDNQIFPKKLLITRSLYIKKVDYYSNSWWLHFIHYLKMGRLVRISLANDVERSASEIECDYIKNQI